MPQVLPLTESVCKLRLVVSIRVRNIRLCSAHGFPSGSSSVEPDPRYNRTPCQTLSSKSRGNFTLCSNWALEVRKELECLPQSLPKTPPKDLTSFSSPTNAHNEPHR